MPVSHKYFGLLAKQCNVYIPGSSDPILRLYGITSGEGLDQGLVLWFPGPHSFTGEDSCELQIHGGTAVIASVLAALSTLPEYQPAQPGKITRTFIATLVIFSFHKFFTH